MTDLTYPYRLTAEPHAWRSMLLLLGCILVGMGIGTMISGVVVVAALMQSGGSQSDLVSGLTGFMQNPGLLPGGWWLLMVVQAVTHICTFLLPALICWRWVEGRRWQSFQFAPTAQVRSSTWLIVVLLVIAFMPFNGLLIEWNQNLHLPDTLKPLEDWMREKEAQAETLTKFLTSFSNPLQLLMAVLVIGLVAAVGEEVLFRGVLQRKFIVWTGSIHAGIWLAAILFSAIHLQFLGFLPRMLLGALFGYLYVWSGNLWIPIVAHFVNNAFTVLMLYLYQNKLTTLNLDEADSVPLPLALGSLVLSVGLLVMFKRKANGES
jgi:uncharacterized protein